MFRETQKSIIILKKTRNKQNKQDTAKSIQKLIFCMTEELNLDLLDASENITRSDYPYIGV